MSGRDFCCAQKPHALFEKLSIQSNAVIDRQIANQASEKHRRLIAPIPSPGLQNKPGARENLSLIPGILSPGAAPGHFPSRYQNGSTSVPYSSEEQLANSPVYSIRACRITYKAVAQRSSHPILLQHRGPSYLRPSHGTADSSTSLIQQLFNLASLFPA